MLRLLENSDSEELQDLLYEKVGELFSSSQSDDEVAAYRTYFLSPSQPQLSVSVREARAVISGGTTGLSSWTAGQSLAAWLDGIRLLRPFNSRDIIFWAIIPVNCDLKAAKILESISLWRMICNSQCVAAACWSKFEPVYTLGTVLARATDSFLKKFKFLEIKEGVIL